MVHLSGTLYISTANMHITFCVISNTSLCNSDAQARISPCMGVNSTQPAPRTSLGVYNVHTQR